MFLQNKLTMNVNPLIYHGLRNEELIQGTYGYSVQTVTNVNIGNCS